MESSSAVGRTEAPSRGGGHGPILDPTTAVEQIALADRRRSLRFRLTFVATWLILVGGFVLFLVAGNIFSADFVATWAPYILGGTTLTIIIAVISIALAIVFAILGALGRLSRSAVVYAVATLYVSLVRGTPLIVQILFIYLALPQIVPQAAAIPTIGLGIFALAFNYGAYMTEIFRAGIQAVSRGQREAAESLGMPESLVMRRVVLPQAIRIVIPAIGNEFISMLKDSALVSIIGVQELLWRADTIGSQHFRTLETLTIAAAVYWLLTIVFSFFQDRLERRLAMAYR
jgi:polar amino acid transport system permease protein